MDDSDGEYDSESENEDNEDKFPVIHCFYDVLSQVNIQALSQPKNSQMQNFGS